MSAHHPHSSSSGLSRGSMPECLPKNLSSGEFDGMDPRHEGEDDSILLERSHSPVCASRAALLWQGSNS